MVVRLLLAALVLIVGIARAATVTGTFKNSDGTAYTSAITFRPVSSPALSGSDVVTGADVKVTPGTNGVITTSLSSGYYSVYIASTRRFSIAVPSGSDTYDVISILATPAWYVPGEAGLSGFSLATDVLAGSVKVDAATTNPVVYLKTSVDTLLEAKLAVTNGTAQGLTLGTNITAQVGTISASAIDLAGAPLQTKTIGAATTFTTSNRTSGRSVLVRLDSGAASYALTWPAWRWASDSPAATSTNKYILLSLTAWGSAETDIIAAALEEP